MTKLSPDNPKSKRSPAAHTFDQQSKPAKKEAGGKVSKVAKTFSIKSPRNRG